MKYEPQDAEEKLFSTASAINSRARLEGKRSFVGAGGPCDSGFTIAPERSWVIEIDPQSALLMKLLKLEVVLAAVDTDGASLDTLRAAREFATAAGASLHVVHVATDSEGAPDVHAVLNRTGLNEGDAVVHSLVGAPPREIRSLADRINADVIVLGRPRGRDATGSKIGSTALAVVTNSWAPCLILSRPLQMPLERVLVPIDLSDTSRGALVVALSWASALRGAVIQGGTAANETTTLMAMLVARSPNASESSAEQGNALDHELDRLREDAGTWAGVAIDGTVVTGSDVPSAIADFAANHKPDLLVLGTRGLGLDAVGRLGSVSLAVSRRVDVPVLLVPPAVWTALGKMP